MIFHITKNWYNIPFYNFPLSCIKKNKKTFLQHGEFVEIAIRELLDDGLIEECS